MINGLSKLKYCLKKFPKRIIIKLNLVKDLNKKSGRDTIEMSLIAIRNF